jgi:hypothetical protein
MREPSWLLEPPRLNGVSIFGESPWRDPSGLMSRSLGYPVGALSFCQARGPANWHTAPLAPRAPTPHPQVLMLLRGSERTEGKRQRFVRRAGGGVRAAVYARDSLRRQSIARVTVRNRTDSGPNYFEKTGPHQSRSHGQRYFHRAAKPAPCRDTHDPWLAASLLATLIAIAKSCGSAALIVAASRCGTSQTFHFHLTHPSPGWASL